MNKDYFEGFRLNEEITLRKIEIFLSFMETGNYFVKDGKIYHLESKVLQSRQAWKSGLQHQGKAIDFKLRKPLQMSFFDDGEWYQKKFRDRCQICGCRFICNGCSNCGQCEK